MPQSAKELFEEFLKTPQSNLQGESLVFEGVCEKDLYNITAAFSMNSKTYIAGRVESIEKEDES